MKIKNTLKNMSRLVLKDGEALVVKLPCKRITYETLVRTQEVTALALGWEIPYDLHRIIVVGEDVEFAVISKKEAKK